MKRNSLPRTELLIALAALACWIVTFLAGTDVWHAAGRPVWKPGDPGYFDLRALAFAYYVLAPLLVAQAVVAFLQRAR